MLYVFYCMCVYYYFLLVFYDYTIDFLYLLMRNYFTWFKKVTLTDVDIVSL